MVLGNLATDHVQRFDGVGCAEGFADLEHQTVQIQAQIQRAEGQVLQCHRGLDDLLGHTPYQRWRHIRTIHLLKSIDDFARSCPWRRALESDRRFASQTSLILFDQEGFAGAVTITRRVNFDGTAVTLEFLSRNAITAVAATTTLRANFE